MVKDRNHLIKNIYYMIAYAFTTLNQNGFDDVEKEDFDNVQNLFAAILAKGVGLQLKRGIYKEYEEFDDSIPYVKGKIDIQKTIRNKMEKKQLVHCSFDELSENNLFNQIIKTTSMLLIKSKEVESEYKDELKRVMLFFEDVSEINPYQINWNGLRFQRNNSSYRVLVSVCQLILEGMLLTTDAGEYRLASFIDDQKMHRLYEKFILEFYIKHFPELDARAEQIDWALDDGYRTHLPIMQSDIMLTNKKGNTLIIDAKYYGSTLQTNYDVQTIHSGNLYQIFTYVKNKQLENPDATVSGLLLYAKTEEDIQPNDIYTMSGNKIGVQTVDLNTAFPEIRDSLKKLASNWLQ